MARLIPFFVLLFVFPSAYAAQTHTVGGTHGWNTGINYDSWANNITFIVGDSLLFIFDSIHSVDEVSQDDYDNCNTGHPINSHESSPTTVALTAADTWYFICSTSNHCDRGMKVAVTVMPVAPDGGNTLPPTPSASDGKTPPLTTSGTTPTTGTPGCTMSILGGWRRDLLVGLGVGFVGLLGVGG